MRPSPTPADAHSAGGVLILIHFALTEHFAAVFDIHRPGALLLMARGVEFALNGKDVIIQREKSGWL